MEITKIKGDTKQWIFPKILNVSTRTLQIWNTTYIALCLKELRSWRWGCVFHSQKPNQTTTILIASWSDFFTHISFENNDISLVFAFWYSFNLPEGCCWDVCGVIHVSVWEWGNSGELWWTNKFTLASNVGCHKHLASNLATSFFF